MSSGPTSIYVASPEGETGKSTIALGILNRLSSMVPKVGVFRPITRREERDYILELLLAQSDAGLTYEECVGVTYQRLHEDTEGAIADIVVFDPATVAPGPVRRIADFPAGSERLTADAPSGVRHVLVNGVPIRVDEQQVDGAAPGVLVAPGR